MHEMKRIIKTTIHDDQPDMRIDRLLTLRYPYYSRSQWQREIRCGKLLLNNRVIHHPSVTIKTGDTIEYIGFNRSEPPIDENYSILYEDRHLVAVNKSGNLPVHPSGIFFNNTLLRILEATMNRKLFPVHRLDRETSGIVLFAKDSPTAAAMQKVLPTARKTYCAIVHGTMRISRFNITTPIGKDFDSPIKKKRKAFADAPEKAHTVIQKILGFHGFTVLLAFPKTGRYHQIRVHLNHAGFPIVGDKLYGIDEKHYLDFIKNGPGDSLLKKLLLGRTALHALSLYFNHPVIEKKVFIGTAIPEDMKKFILEGHYHG